MPKNSEIQIRDPFVLPVHAEGVYYLFGSTDKDIWGGAPGEGFDCYRSATLDDWEGPIPAFRPPPGFWATQNFWAPEVHPYKGRYYMLASFKAPGVCRGTQALVADTPAGPYVPHSDGPLTPRHWECLDGTLHVDEDGQPWMVFCHEWAQVVDGEMCAVRLSNDLITAMGEPVVLFRASEPSWSVELRQGKNEYVTDGPFLFRGDDGTLWMLWATFGTGGYIQSLARSESGKVKGPWIHEKPLFEADGGHGMVFRAFDGTLMLTLHQPNQTPNERPHFFPVDESGGTLTIRA